MTAEQQNAIKLLAASMTPLAASVALQGAYNDQLKAQEDAKAHPMSDFALAPDQWATEKAYMTDGGGVVDDSDLAVELMTALSTDDQITFWRDVMHLVKSTLKTKGYMTVGEGGGVFMRGVAVP